MWVSEGEAIGRTDYWRDQEVPASCWRACGVSESQGTRPAAVCVQVKATSPCDVRNKAIAGLGKPSKL